MFRPREHEQEAGAAMKNLCDFLAWEKASRDTIDVKRMYIDVTGDLMAGVLLSQIVFWHLPDKQGQSKLSVERDGHRWLAKAREDWWDECRIAPRQMDRLLPLLEGKGLVETRTWKFSGSPTTHIRLVWSALLPLLDEIVACPPLNPYKPAGTGAKRSPRMVTFISPVDAARDDEMPRSHGAVTSISPSAQDGSHETGRTSSPFGEVEVTDAQHPYTETTAQTTHRIHTDNNNAALPTAVPHRGPPVVVLRVCRGPDAAMTPLPAALPEPDKTLAPNSEASQAAVEALSELGVSRRTAQRIVKRRGEAAALAWAGAVRGGHVDCSKRGPAAILVAALDGGNEMWSLPPAYLNAQRDARRRAAQQAEKARQVEFRKQGAEQVKGEWESLEARWNEMAAHERAAIEEQARKEIARRPMGKRLLEGVVGKETLRQRCIEIIASHPASKCSASVAIGGNQRAPTNNKREQPLKSQN